jgi:hypothetical protein
LEPVAQDQLTEAIAAVKVLIQYFQVLLQLAVVVVVLPM